MTNSKLQITKKTPDTKHQITNYKSQKNYKTQNTKYPIPNHWPTGKPANGPTRLRSYGATPGRRANGPTGPRAFGHTEMKKLTLTLLPEMFGIYRLRPSENIPAWAFESAFFSITRTSRELSIVCPDRRIPSGVAGSRRWRALSVKGTLDFTEIGVIASLAVPLKEARVPIFVISTFDTDYLLVRERHLKTAVDVLSHEGHRINLRGGRASSPNPNRP